MFLSRLRPWIGRCSIATAVASAAFIGLPEEARAEGPVSGTGKGIVGGALLGAEVVTITMGIIGVEDVWPYLVFGAVGAGAGGVGGWAVEQADPPAEAPLAMLAGGMALVIPAVVVTLDATAYDPESDLDSDDPVDNEPVDGPEGEASITLGANRAPVGAARTALIDFRFTEKRDQLALGAPALAIRPSYSREEMAMVGLMSGASPEASAAQPVMELHVPVVAASF